MRKLQTNRKGQFSIIAALLVAVILIAAVITTYSAIRYSPVKDQPQVLSAIDEINLALKQIVGFTLGYYGSVLQVSGNTSYAKLLASRYLESGLSNIGDIRPEWGASFDITTLDLQTNWFSKSSFSYGNLSITYDLTGIGLYDINYFASSILNVEISESSSNKAVFTINKDGNQPIVNIAKNNIQFYHYLDSASKWELVTPDVEPIVYANGTYLIDFPAEIDPESYFMKIEDQRGIIVIASSVSSYEATLMSSSTHTDLDFVDNNDSNVDSSEDKGTHSNFGSQQSVPDLIFDTLTEVDTYVGSSNFTLVNNESFEGTWLPTGWSESSSGQWNRESDQTKNGNYSADFDGQNPGLSGSLITPKWDCSDADRIFLDFWFYDDGCDPGEFMVEYHGEDGWGYTVQLGSFVENEWVHYQDEISDSNYLVSDFQIRIRINDLESNEHAYVDLVTVKKATDNTNYELDLEEQFTNVNYTNPNQDLCIKTGSLGSESLMVDVWTGTSWSNIATLTGLINGWRNVSVSSYLTSETLTIRFRGNSESSDLVQDSWEIDAVLLGLRPELGFLVPEEDSTIIVEWLQNGTMRFLGEKIEMTTRAYPIPPISVKSLHLTQTINGVSQEVPFQVEDWASEYRIPLGLTENSTVFSNSQMIVFLLDSSVSEFRLWWNGSDNALQTPLAYTNQYFTGDDPDSNRLTNGILSLQIGSFSVTSTVVSKSTSSTATFMRINGESSVYGAGAAYVIYNGIVRDIVQQEAEWASGAVNCPNVYANIVIMLPAKVNYYTYRLRLMFIESEQPRTITDLCPIRLTTSTSSIVAQTENGTSNGLPIVTTGTGTFYNFSSNYAAHHWSQLISDSTKGTGILFTDSANLKLYTFDSIAGTEVGALEVDTSAKTIELLPVGLNSVNFTTALDVTWTGAVATFDDTMPIYKLEGSIPTGLWVLAEHLPVIAVTSES
jgi:hypothetical protein